MRINQKVILLTVVPVVLAMVFVLSWFARQTQEFSELQAQEFERAIVEMRKAQLRDYVAIVQAAVAHMRPSAAEADTVATADALFAVLAAIDYSEDGYFYVYDTNGVNLVHPRQPYRVGKNWLDLEDERGKLVIRDLLAQAKRGGGYTEYQWEKPSTNAVATKIGYAEMLGDWGWMIGTGAYVDDIAREVASVQAAMAPHTEHTFRTGATAAVAAVIAVFGCGLLLQINEKKLADGKLRELTRRIVLTQDEERRRVSRELHDSISQSLIGVKYLLEDVELQHADRGSPAPPKLALSLSHLDRTLEDVRTISRNLHPSILDDIGLMAAVEALIDGFSERTGIGVEFGTVKVRNLLPEEARTALYRVVQEALTNVERHAQAKHVSVNFNVQGPWFGVTVTDDGIGFDRGTVSGRESRGIGLRNISERLSYFGGVCDISSSSAGTTLFAGVPKSLLRHSHAAFEAA
ncbi:MAG: cache domain-containing protein [Pseudomonadota bacterium]